MSERAETSHAAQAQPSPPRVGLTSVVIVAADSGPGLVACVESVLASAADLEVIIVDNASVDAAPEAVAARWAGDARVRVLRNAANLGFGSGCNRGAAAAHGDALLFLNPDCVVEPGTIGALRATLAPGIGLVGAAIVDAAGRPESASRRRDPTLRRVLMTLSGLARFEARWPAFAGVALAPAAATRSAQAVDAVSGAVMLLPRAVFAALDGFDERYFLHAEDLDLCRRVRDAGDAVVCANAVTVVHRKGGSSRHRGLFVAAHKRRSLWRWFRKFDPAARNPLLRLGVWGGLWLHYLALYPRAAWRQWQARRQG